LVHGTEVAGFEDDLERIEAEFTHIEQELEEVD
jgi:hypothetical protein